MEFIKKIENMEYSESFVLVKLLLILGDIKSSLGPPLVVISCNTPRKETQINVIKSPVGQPKKKGFTGTPKKLSFQAHTDFNVIQRVQVVSRLPKSWKCMYSLPYFWNFVQLSLSVDSVMLSYLKNIELDWLTDDLQLYIFTVLLIINVYYNGIWL